MYRRSRYQVPASGEKPWSWPISPPPAHTPLSFLGEESGDLNNFAEMQKQGQAKSPLPPQRNPVSPKVGVGTGEKGRQ